MCGGCRACVMGGKSLHVGDAQHVGGADTAQGRCRVCAHRSSELPRVRGCRACAQGCVFVQSPGAGVQSPWMGCVCAEPRRRGAEPVPGGALLGHSWAALGLRWLLGAVSCQSWGSHSFAGAVTPARGGGDAVAGRAAASQVALSHPTAVCQSVTVHPLHGCVRHCEAPAVPPGQQECVSSAGCRGCLCTWCGRLWPVPCMAISCRAPAQAGHALAMQKASRCPWVLGSAGHVLGDGLWGAL